MTRVTGPGRRRRPAAGGGDTVTDDTGMRYYVYKQNPLGGVLQEPYLAGTSNNKRLADEMCIWLCRENPLCIAWVVSAGEDPMSVSPNSRRYWARKVRETEAEAKAQEERLWGKLRELGLEE